MNGMKELMISIRANLASIRQATSQVNSSIQSMMNKIGGTARAGMDKVNNAFKSGINSMKSGLSGVANATGLMSVFDSLRNKVRSTFTDIRTYISSMRNTSNMTEGLWGRLFNDNGQARNLFGAIYRVRQVAQSVMGNPRIWGSYAINSVSQSLSGLVGIVRRVGQSVSQALGNPRTWGSHAINLVGQSLSGLVGIVRRVGQSAGQAGQAMGNPRTWGSHAINLVSQSLSGLVGRFRRVGQSEGQAAQETTRGCQEMGNGFKVIVLSAIIEVTQKIIELGKKVYETVSGFIKLGAGIENTFNRVSAVFKGGANDVAAWADALERGYGINATDLLNDVSTFTTLAKGFGIAAKDAETLGKNLVLLSRDYAAFLGMDTKMVKDALRSGLIGQTESIQKLGIQIEQTMLKQTAARYGIKKQVQNMNDIELAYMRYISIMDQAGDANGFFVKSLNSSQTQLTLISNTVKRIQNIIGQVFSELFSKIGQYVLGMFLLVEDAFKGLAKLMNIDLGIKGSSSQKGVEQATDKVVGNLDASNKKAKELRKTLGNFDELSTLGNNKDSDAGDSATAPSNVDTSIWDTFNKMQSAWGENNLLDKVRDDTKKWLDSLGLTIPLFDEMGKSFKTKFADRLGEVSFSNILNGLKNIGKSIGEIGAGLSGNLRDMLVNWSGGLGEAFGGVSKTAIGIGESLVGGVSLYLEQNKGRLIDTLNDIFKSLGEYFKNAGSLVGNIGDILYGFFSSETTQQAVADCISILSSIVLEPAKLISKFLADSFGEANTYLTNLKPLIEEALGNISSVVQGITGTIDKVVKDLFTSIGNTYDQYVRPALTNFREGFEKISATVMKAWNECIYPMIQGWITEFNRVYDEALKPLLDEVVKFVGKLIENASVIFEKFIVPIVSCLVEKLYPVFAVVFSTIGDVVGTTVQLIAGVLKGLIRILGGLIDFLVGVFTGDWKKAWTGLKDIVCGVWDGLASILKAPINLLIDELNLLIGAINKLSFTVPDWVPDIGGEKFGFSIPKVPKLADGGIVTSATQFIAGEAGAEVVFPLQNSRFIADFAKYVADSISGSGKNGVNFNIGTLIQDDRSYEWLADMMAKFMTRNGYLSNSAF